MQLTEQQNSMMIKHLMLVIEANQTVNLTRVDTLESGKVLHIEDSLAGLPEMIEAPEGFYADLGTGGGYPGIVLSIATGRDTLLVDSVGKKTKALDNIVNELELESQIRTYTGRIEELSLERPHEFAVLTARALTALPSLIELASPLLQDGGWIICYKSAQYEEELSQAISMQYKVGMEHKSTRTFALSDGTPRTVIVFEKVSEPQVKLPRRPGMAQKRPYK